MPGELTATNDQAARSSARLARDSDLRRVLSARSLRAFGDSYVAILPPIYLTRLDFEPYAIGVVTAATLLGSALLTLALGRFGTESPDARRWRGQPF